MPPPPPKNLVFAKGQTTLTNGMKRSISRYHSIIVATLATVTKGKVLQETVNLHYNQKVQCCNILFTTKMPQRSKNAIFLAHQTGPSRGRQLPFTLHNKISPSLMHLYPQGTSIPSPYSIFTNRHYPYHLRVPPIHDGKELNMPDSIVESTTKYAGETMTKDLAESLAKNI